MDIEKVYTDNPFVDELLYNLKIIAYNSVLKDEAKALSNETVDSLKQSSLYMASLEGRALFELFDYTRPILETAQIPHNLIPKCITNREFIPIEYRETVRQLMMAKTINEYVELNEYYRKITGKPPIGVIGLKIDKYKYLIPEGNDVDYNLYVHQMSADTISMLNYYGVINKLIEDNPGEEYLKYITKDISIYDARRMEQFQLLYTPNIGNLDILNKFKNKFNNNRTYIIKAVYSEAYKFNSDYYDNFIMLFMVLQTMIDMLVEVQEHIVRKDILDARCIEYLFASYGVPYYREIPIKFQINMIKNINSLIKYKSSSKGMLNICSLFGFDDIEIFKYYILKDRKLNSYGDYIYNYNTVLKSTYNTDVKYEMVELTLPVVDINNITIPFIFSDYMEKGNVLFIRLDDIIIDRSEYYISVDNKLQFNDLTILDNHNKLIFDFYYDITTKDKEYQQIQNNNIIVSNEYVFVEESDQTEFDIPLPYPEYLNDGNNFILIIGTTFVHNDRYTIIDNKVVFNQSDDWNLLGRELIFIFIYSEYLNIKIDRTSITAEQNEQVNFKIPDTFPNYIDGGNQFLLSIGSTYSSPSSYKTHHNDLTILQQAESVSKGIMLDFINIYNSDNNSYGSVEFKEDILELIATEDFQTVFNISLPFINYLEKGNKVFAKLRGNFLNTRLYSVFSNAIIINDQSISLNKGDKLYIHFIYNNNETQNIISSSSKISEQDHQTIFIVPYPIEYFIGKGNKMKVDISGVLLKESDYSLNLDDNTITLKNIFQLPSINQEVNFTFLYNRNNIYNVKLHNFITKTTKDDQNYFNITFPFYRYLETGNGFLVFINSVYIDPSRYTISGNRIFLKDIILPKDITINIVFIYNSIYLVNNSSLIVENRIVDLVDYKDSPYVTIPVPFKDYLENDYPFFIYNNNISSYIYTEEYDIINTSIIFNDLSTIDNLINFVFVYKPASLYTIYEEDYVKNFNLKFIKIPLDEYDTDKYIKDKSAHLDYNSITLSDSMWDGESGDHDEIKLQILEREFNYERTKYLSIDSIVEFTELTFDFPYFFNILFDKVLLEDELRVKLPSISKNKMFRISDIFCYLFALRYEYNGLKDTLMDTPSKVMYIKGFNFEADLATIRDYILSKRRRPEDYNIFNFQIPETNILTFNQLLYIFNTNKDIYKYVSYEMINADTKDIYDIWKKIYDSLMIIKFNMDFFKKSNGEQATTYTDFLQDKEQVLYYSLNEIRAIQDINTRNNTIIDTISDVVYILDEYIDSEEFKYIYYTLPGFDRANILNYILKVINFFKSYKVHMFELNILYKFGNSLDTNIKPIDKMITKINTTYKQKYTPVEVPKTTILPTYRDKVEILEKITFKYF